MSSDETPIVSHNAAGYPTYAEAYELKDELDKGATATVYRATCKTKEGKEIPVAVKIIDLEKSKTGWDSVAQEVKLMSSLRHPNVTPLLASFTDLMELWLILPLAGGSCRMIMRTIERSGLKDEKVIATILHQTLEALAYLHKRGTVHRDIKAGNLLIGIDGSIQVSDFGVAASLFQSGRKAQAYTFVGTPCWMAPEVLQSDDKDGYGAPADIWSLGITALELAFGLPPFFEMEPIKVMMIILDNEPPSEKSYKHTDRKLSSSFKSFIKAALVKDPLARPSAEELLKHKFIKSAKSNAYIVEKVMRLLPPDFLTMSDTTIVRSRKSKKRTTGGNNKSADSMDKPITIQSFDFGSSSNVKFTLDSVDEMENVMENRTGESDNNNINNNNNSKINVSKTNAGGGNGDGKSNNNGNSGGGNNGNANETKADAGNVISNNGNDSGNGNNVNNNDSSSTASITTTISTGNNEQKVEPSAPIPNNDSEHSNKEGKKVVKEEKKGRFFVSAVSDDEDEDEDED